MKFTLLLGLVFTGFVSASAAEQNQPPDLVMDLADDFSAADLSLYVGNNVAAPAIDLLAPDGVAFNRTVVAIPSFAVRQLTRTRIVSGYEFDAFAIRPNLLELQPTVRIFRSSIRSAFAAAQRMGGCRRAISASPKFAAFWVGQTCISASVFTHRTWFRLLLRVPFTV